MSKITYQGIPGSFTYNASQKYFGNNHVFCAAKSFKDIFEHVKKGISDHGVIPIENSLAGSIYENYDLLNRYELKIIGENYLKIQHCLLSIPCSRLKSINKAISHPKALEQCLNFFEKHPWLEKVMYSDTASAAQFISQQKNKSYAAIASPEAAKIYNLKIIQKNIEDNKQNYTRFLVIANKPYDNKKVDKCSLIFKLSHVPGSLHKALGLMAINNLNLTKIESRPIHGLLFEYVFYLDFEFNNLSLSKVKQIIKKLENKTQELRVLGYYKKYENT